MSERTVATNRKAKRDYHIEETLEAGIVLKGTEIKSVRAGQVSLNEAFVLIDDNLEAWLVDAYIAPYRHGSHYNHDPRRKRKLLLHKKEILRLWNRVREKGMTIIPLRMKSPWRGGRRSTTSARKSRARKPNGKSNERCSAAVDLLPPL